MRKGFWNYSEPVEYRFIMVKLLPVKEPPMHWQNAFAYEHRQVMEVVHNGKSFYLDNQDGSGRLKILAGGGPGSMSRHVEAHELIGLVPDGQEVKYDPERRRIEDEKIEAWQKKSFPAEYEKVQALKMAWTNSPYKKMLDDLRTKEIPAP